MSRNPRTPEDGTDKVSRNISNYRHTLRNIPEERRSHVLRGGRLKWRIDCSSWRHECCFLYVMYDCYWKVRSYRPWLPVRRL